MKNNNDLFDIQGNDWWADDAGFEFTSLRYCINPLRYGYFKKKLHQLHLPGKIMLDIGCGGGFLAEEFAKDGFKVTGIDPVAVSINAARSHACENNLNIDYLVGRGESLPFPDSTFNIVACCDVIEHVEDSDKVISEASRTLKEGGVFLFDTINRTWVSKMMIIKILQQWRLTRIFP